MQHRLSPPSCFSRSQPADRTNRTSRSRRPRPPSPSPTTSRWSTPTTTRSWPRRWRCKTAVDAFVAAPSAATQDAAKQAWIAARAPYGPSEAFRFYDGPIDAPETGPEGLINAWPLDENYIDYVRGADTAGIINNTATAITAEAIEMANEMAGEKNISTGYHAIEFLLWGQDDELPANASGTTNGAGKRPFSDYVDGGTAQNQERRRTYLKLVTQLLITHLQTVAAAWKPGVADNFAASFGVTAKEGNAQERAIADLLKSLGSMAKAELSGERMTVAYKLKGQEDEHSCFSDNTAADLLGNGVGSKTCGSVATAAGTDRRRRSGGCRRSGTRSQDHDRHRDLGHQTAGARHAAGRGQADRRGDLVGRRLARTHGHARRDHVAEGGGV